MPNRRGKEEPGSNGDGKGKIKFRYLDSERALDFSVENVGGDTVAESLRSIANALAGRTIAPLRNPKAKGSLSSGSTVEVEDEPENIEEELEEVEVPEVEEEGAESDRTSRPKRIIKPKTPKLLQSPNLTEATVQLAEFMKQKNPPEMIYKYAVIAVWYKEQFQITDMNIDRIFTAFKLLGQESQLPTDIEKPLKNLTYVKKWFEKAKTPNTYNIIWLGESEVGKMGAAKA